LVKTCTKCLEIKPLDAFSRNKNRVDGLQHQCKACNSAYYKQNAERIIARVLAATDPEAARVKAREWYAANIERAKASGAKWRAENKAVKAEHSARWAMNNREKVSAATKEWRKANPEYVNAKTREYRARKRGAQGKHTAADVKALMKTQKCMCAVCRIDITDAYHVDHIMPLVLGGSNDRTNLQLLCPSCNTSKGGKHPVDFMQKRGFLI
jgi:5-methylcytosine-specific restriction endonuclease McrA